MTQQLNLSTVRVGLNRVVDSWRNGEAQQPIYVGVYGSAEAVIAPMAVWESLIAALAKCWDSATAPVRGGRLGQGAAQPSTLVELASSVGQEVPVPVLQSRGVPRGGADLAVWPQALEDLRQLQASGADRTIGVALRLLGEALQDKVRLMPSACGRGTQYAFADVDGLHAVTLSLRPASRPLGRRGPGPHRVVELAGVDRIDWASGGR